MISLLKQSIGNALEARRNAPVTSIYGVAAGLAMFLIVAVVVALIAAPEGDINYHFTRERGIITAVSAILLSMACGFSGLAFFLSVDSKNAGRYFWLLSTIAFCYLSLDELLEFHELGGEFIEDRVGDTESFRSWNDVIVILYGVLAIPVFIGFCGEILRYPKVAECFLIAFVFYCIHTIVDSVAQPRTDLSTIIEESAKIISSGTFALGMLVAVLGIKDVTVPKKTTNP